MTVIANVGDMQLGHVVCSAYKDANGVRTVLRQHEIGFSKTILDTTTRPHRTIHHEEFLTTSR